MCKVKFTKKIISALALAVLMLLCNINNVKAQNVCKIGTIEYATITQALSDVQNGETIDILVSEIAMPLIHNTAKSFTIKGLSSKGNGTTVTSWDCGTGGDDKAILNGITFQNLNVTPSISFYGNNTVFNNVEFTEGVFYGYIGSQASEDNGPVTFNNCKLLATSQQYGLHFDELHDDLIVNNCEIKGTVALSQPTNPDYTINFTGCDFTGRGGGSQKCNINFYSNATLTDCTFTDDYCNGSGRGILTVNPNTLVELNNCTLSKEQSGYMPTDFIRRDYVSCAAFDAKKNGYSKFTDGTFVANTQNELNMFCDESIQVDWLGNSTVFTYDAKEKTVNIEGNVDGTVKVPMDADLTIADNATFAEESRVYLPTGRSSEYYKEWVDNNVPASAAETVTVKGWCLSIENNGYYTLADAAKAVTNGQTIKLLDNINEAEAVTTPADISFTIDMNGFNYANAEAIANNSTKITLIDSKETTAGLSFSAKSYTGDLNVGEANGKIVLTTNSFTQATGTLNAYGDVTMTGFNLGNVQLGFETGTATSDKMTLKGPEASAQTVYVGQADMDDALNVEGWLDRSYTLDIVGEENVTENISIHSLYLRTTGTVNVTDADFNIKNYVITYGDLNFTRSTVTFNGANFYIVGRPSKMADGKAIVALDNSSINIPCTVEMGGGTSGCYGSGLLEIRNNSTLSAHNLLMDVKKQDVTQTIKTVVDNSKLMVQNNNNGTFEMRTGTELEIIVGENSEVSVDKFTNNGGTIWVDMSNATKPIYKLIDAGKASNYGESIANYKFVEGNENGYVLVVIDNDLFASKSSMIDMSTLLVDASYTSYKYGDVIEGHDGFYYGFNAFDNLKDIKQPTWNAHTVFVMGDGGGSRLAEDEITLECGTYTVTNNNINSTFNVNGLKVGKNSTATLNVTNFNGNGYKFGAKANGTINITNSTIKLVTQESSDGRSYIYAEDGGHLNLTNVTNVEYSNGNNKSWGALALSTSGGNSTVTIKDSNLHIWSLSGVSGGATMTISNSTIASNDFMLEGENSTLNLTDVVWGISEEPENYARYFKILNDCNVTMTRSSIATTSFTNNGTINIDMTGMTGESYKIIDYTGNGSMTLPSYGNVVISGGNYMATVVNNDLYVTTAVCVIGNTQYLSLADAYEVVKTGETIKLLTDTVYESLTNGKDFTLDLNGKVITALNEADTVIINNGTLTLTDGVGGGNITGGKVGVKQNGALTLSGNVRITDNTNKNLYLLTGKTFSIDTPTNGMNVGISTQADPTQGGYIELTGENDKDYSQYFFSDNATYPIRNITPGNKLVLTHDVKITLTADGNGSVMLNGKPYEKPVFVVRGSEVTIKATADNENAFKGWFKSNSEPFSGKFRHTFTASENIELEARFTDQVIWVRVKKGN